MSNEEKIFLLSMAEKDVEAQSSAYDWYKLGQDMMKRIALEKESNEIKAYLEELQELRAYLKELEEAETTEDINAWLADPRHDRVDQFLAEAQRLLER